MQALNFNLRGIDPIVMNKLKQKAKIQHTSVNVLILNCITHSLGFSHKVHKPSYDDLDYLAGTWSQEDAVELKNHTAYFETIDDELWS